MEVVSRLKLLTADLWRAATSAFTRVFDTLWRRAKLSESPRVKLRRDLAAIFLIYPDGARLPI
jgi:hypothetical protein